MRRRILALAAGALLAVSAAPASATTHADPTGDMCKAFTGQGQFCGFDIKQASDTTDAHGSVHIGLTYAQHECTGNIGAIGVMAASFEFYDDAVTAPAPFGPHMKAILSHGAQGWQVRELPGNVVTPINAVVTGTTTVTLDAPLPPAVAGRLGHFRWLASNSCIGESPSEGSDLAPNTGLYDHNAAGGGTGGGVTRAAATTAVAKALAGTKPTSAATLIKKGLPVTFTAPGAGTLRITLGRIKFIRVHGRVARAQAPVLGKLTVKVTKAGRVTKTVKLSRAGKAQLKKARKTNKLKLTVSFTSGAVAVSKSKTVKVKPPRH